MSFITPILLWGMAALSIPLLIHFLRQSPRRRYPFPSLYLIKKVTQKYRKRLAMMELLLLLLRMALVASIVLAFAGPKRLEQSAEGGVGKNLILLYDDSPSMAKKRGGTSLFESQRVKMKAILADADKGSRVTLLSVSGQQIQVEGPEGALKSLGTLAVRYGPSSVGKSLERVKSIFGKEGGRLYLLGDFQKTTWKELGWRPQKGVEVHSAQLLGELGGKLDLEDIGSQGSVSRGAPFQLGVNVSSQGLARGAPIKVVAEVEGGTQGETNLQAGPGPRKALFSLQSNQTGLAGVRVHANSGTSAYTGFGLVGVGGLGRTLVVAPNGDATAEVLMSLLEASDGPAPSLVMPSLLPGVPLSRYQTIVLVGADPNMANRRSAFLNAAEGGAVILSIPGGASEALTRSTKLLLSKGAPLEVSGAGDNSFWTVRSEEAMLGLVGLIPGNWPSVRVKKAVKLPVPPKGEVLAKLSNGGAAFVKETIGTGAWISIAMGLNPKESDLAYMPAFAPLLLKLMQPNLGHSDWQVSQTGEPMILPWKNRPAGLVKVEEVFSGEVFSMQVGQGGRVSSYLPPGVWRLENEVLRFAVNLNVEERSGEFFGPEDITSLVPGVEIMTGSGVGQVLSKSSTDPLVLARIIAVLAVLLLLVEALYANSRRLNAPVGVS